MTSKGGHSESKNTINFNGRIVSLHQPLVMGILNLTPDSFYAESRVSSTMDLLGKVGRMLQDGADMIDIGGYSTRPGAAEVSEREELARVVPAIQAILSKYPDCLLSVDTFRSEVAKQALQNGAVMVNDVSGGEMDTGMYDVVGQHGAHYVLMHMRGTPQTMASLTEYNDLFIDITDYFIKKIDLLRSKGVKDIIVDLGFGFAKSIEQNFALLNGLAYFQHLQCPILVGISRKSMIYRSLGVTADEALNGTTALHMAALMNGASLLRVHDVREAKETIELYNLLKG